MVKIFFAVPPLWRRRVEGLENLDSSKSYVIVMNHSSMLDIPILYMLPLNFRWVSKREVFSIPIFGQFLRLHGDITIERGNGKAAMEQVTRQGCEWIRRGASVAIFPEGTRTRTGEIGRFKAGAFNLAREAGVEILPVVIDGTRSMIRGGLFDWRSSLTLRVLQPVVCDNGDHVATREVMDRVRADMSDALEQIRAASASQDEVRRTRRDK
ncbi:MAG: lysophospholipid acyltransferase family protein [Rikenellaceae bacterium]